MSASIIDAFVVTLGLDGALFKRGMKDAQDAQYKLSNSSKKHDKEREQSEKEAAAARKKRQQEADAEQKKTAEGYKKIRNELLGLAAVFTAGVGIKDFISNTINGAVGLGYLSQNLRMSTQDLTSWQRASERAGGTSGGIIAQLKESADTLAQFRSGLGPNEGLQNFFRFGGNASELKDGNTYLLARSRIIADLFKQDPSRAALVARQMGIGEDQFDFLKQGPAAVMALVQAQEKNAAITAKNAEDAKELRNKWLDLTDSLQSVATKILVALLPSFSKFADVILKMTGHLTDNKDVIAEWVGKLADFNWSKLADDAKEFAGDVKSITNNLRELIDRWDDWTGKPRIKTPGVEYLPGAIKVGTKEAIDADKRARGEKVDPSTGRPQNATLAKINDVMDEAIARTLASFGVQSAKEWIRDHTGHDDYLAGPKGSVATPKAGAGDADLVRKRLEQYGWSKEQAAGITASFIQESSLNPGERNTKSGAYGIGQWLGSRVGDFKAFSGRDLAGSSLDDQLAFFQYEVTKGKEQDAGRMLRAAKTAEEAARIHSQAYERPGQAEANVARRQRLAGQLAAGDRANNASAVGSVPSGPSASVAGSTTTSTSTSKTDVNVEKIEIHTGAKDADEIAKSIAPAVQKYSFATQGNTGMR